MPQTKKRINKNKKKSNLKGGHNYHFAEPNNNGQPAAAAAAAAPDRLNNAELEEAIRLSMVNQKDLYDKQVQSVLNKSRDSYEEQRRLQIAEEQRARNQLRRKQEKEYKESLAANKKKNEAKKIAKQKQNEANRLAKELEKEQAIIAEKTNAEKRAERASAALKRQQNIIPVVNDNSDEFFSPNEVSNSNNNEGSNSNNSENFTYFIEEYEKELKRRATEEEKQRFREKYFS